MSMITQNDLEYKELARLAKNWHQGYPLKVRKTRLLQALDLPLNETFVFPREMLVKNDTAQLLAVTERLFRRYVRVVVRTAWTPDLLDAPWFKTMNMGELQRVLEELSGSTFDPVSDNSRFTHLIIHGDPSNPSDPTDRYNYLAGRLLFHPCQDIPIDRTIEVVFGEYFAKILDTHCRDDRFACYRIDVGQKSWCPIQESPWITTDDMRILFGRFKNIEGRLGQLMQVLGFVAGKPVDTLALIVEFIVSKGSDSLFFTYDFDFAFSGRGWLSNG